MITDFKLFENNITKETAIFKRDSDPITNNPKILNILVNYQMEAYRNKEKNLSRNLIDELTNLFGAPNKSIRLEFMTKLWILKYKDLTFNVFTAKKKGTSIEICGYTYEEINNGDRQEDIIDFLETLYSLINNISVDDLILRRSTRKYNL